MPPSPRAVFRFAPSPNGELHLGHALSALVGHDWARRIGGRFLVRIEDIDQDRSREEYMASILEDLAWLGLTWEEPVRRQSEHFADYAAAAQRLAQLGVLYPCFATRGEIAAAVATQAARGHPVGQDPDGTPLYPGLHRNLPAETIVARHARGERSALRLDMARALAIVERRLDGRALTFLGMSPEAAGEQPSEVGADPARWGDAVLVRKDTPASYHLAVVVDDALQGVTHVTRGQDLLAATGLHRMLQVLLDVPAPAYHHHALVLGADGQKLSKSTDAPTLKRLRGQGASLGDIRRMLAPFGVACGVQ